jgi:hypothetical protein
VTPAIGALGIIRQGHSIINGSQGKILIAEMFNDENEKNAELRRIEDALSKIDLNLKKYEQLALSRESDINWKKFKPAWEEWQKDSAQFAEFVKQAKEMRL